MVIERSTEQERLMKEIRTKADNASQLAKVVIETTSLLSAVLGGVSSPESGVRFKCAKILKIMSEENPEVLYPHFDFFERLLDNTNNILKWNSIDIITNLVAVDYDNRFESLFHRFYSLLKEGNLITAAHVVEGSAKVVKARPGWETKITHALLGVEKVPLPTEECRNILRGKVISAFAQYVSQSKNRQKMLRFAGEQLNNTRPATKKKAEEFLKKFSFVTG